MDRKMIDYLPEIMKDIAEFIQISEAEQTVKERMWYDIYKMFDEGFISTQTEIGIKRWEETLGITPKDNDTIETRRAAVWIRLLSNIPYTLRTFKAMLDNVLGADGYTVKTDDTIVKITMPLAFNNIFDNILEIADEIVPAHIIIYIELEEDLAVRQPYYVSVGGVVSYKPAAIIDGYKTDITTPQAINVTHMFDNINYKNAIREADTNATAI